MAPCPPVERRLRKLVHRKFAQTSGACDLHRAEVVAAQQILPEALTCINDALPKLSAEKSWSLGEGFRVRGDIFAMIGDLTSARADYDQAYALGWDAEPGNAVLLFETGDLDGALAALDRALQGMSWFHLQRRGNLLVNAACIAARGGRSAQASIYLDEIDAQPERWRQPATQALIAETKAALCEPGNPNGHRLLLLARQLWTSAGVEYHAARVRLQLASALLRSGDVGGRRWKSPRLRDRPASWDHDAWKRKPQRFARAFCARASRLSMALRRNSPSDELIER